MNTAYNFTHYSEAKDESNQLMNEVKKISKKVHAGLKRTSHPRSRVVLFPTIMLLSWQGK